MTKLQMSSSTMKWQLDCQMLRQPAAGVGHRDFGFGQRLGPAFASMRVVKRQFSNTFVHLAFEIHVWASSFY